MTVFKYYYEMQDRFSVLLLQHFHHLKTMAHPRTAINYQVVLMT